MSGVSMQQAPVGGGFSPSAFQSLKSSTTQITTGTMADITNIATPTINDGDFTQVNATGILTAVNAGTYSVTSYACGIQTGNNRCQSEIQMLLDTGGGFAVVAGAFDKQYSSRNTAQPEGSMQFSSFLIRLDVDDDLKFQMRDVGVPITIGEDDFRISIVRIGATGRT